MRKHKTKLSDIPHYDNLPFLVQDFIKYKGVIEDRTFKTLRSYTYDLLFFIKYIVSFKNNDDLSNLNTVKIAGLDAEFFQSITRADILEYLFYLKSEKNNSARTRYRRLEGIKSFFRYLHKESVIEKDVAADIDLPNLEQTLPKYLTEPECKILLNHIESNDYERDYCIIVVFLICGLRLSELVNIDIPDIQNNMLKVYGKGKKEREVAITPICANAINQYLMVRGNCEKTIIHKNALFISRKTGKRLSERRVQQIVSKALTGAGFQGYSAHKLRHTAATLAHQNGADVRVLQEMLGHENLSTTQIYTHVNSEQIKEVAYKNPLATYQPNKSEIELKKSS